MKKWFAFLLFFVLSAACCALAEGSISIGSVPYDSLDEAIAAAKSKDTIVLTGTIELSQSITVPAGKEITISGGTITRGTTDGTTPYTGTFISIEAGASLELSGVTVDGGNAWKIDHEKFEKMKAKELGYNTNDLSTYPVIFPSDGVMATGHMIVNAGVLKLTNDSVLQNHFGSGTSAIYAKPPSDTIVDHSRITACGTKGSGGVYAMNQQYAYDGSSLTLRNGAVIDECFGLGNGAVICAYSHYTSPPNPGRMAYIQIDDASIENCYGISGNGMAMMLVNSKLIMNKGSRIVNVDGATTGNDRLSTVYMHLNSEVEMNDGLIEGCFNNNGALDAAGRGNSKLTLNGGTIRNNEIIPSRIRFQDVFVQSNMDPVFGKDMVVEGYLYLKNDAVNYGRLSGEVFVFNGMANHGVIEGIVKVALYNGETASYTGSGTLNGKRWKWYLANSGESVVRFDYADGKDIEGWDGNSMALATGTALTQDMLPKPKRSGYRLVGWEGFTDGMIIDTTVMLTAIWEEDGSAGAPGTADLPQTGDGSMPGLYLLGSVVSAAGLLILKRRSAS